MSRSALLLLTLAAPAAAADLPPGAVARLGGTAFRHPDRPAALAFSPDGRHLASGGSDGALRVWDPDRGTELFRFAVPGGSVPAVAYSADGRVLAADFGDRKPRLFDARTFRLTRTVPAGEVESLTLSADGGLIGVSRPAGTLGLIEAATGLDRMELPNGKGLAIAPDGSAVAASDAGDAVTVYEVPSGRPRLTVRHPNRDGVTALAISPDGSRLATADPGETGRVRVWDLKTGQRLAEWVGEGPVVFRSADVLLGRRGGSVVTWDVKADKPVRELPVGAMTFALSPDGRRLATAGDRPRIRLWDVATGEERLPAGEQFRDAITLTAAPDGRVLLAAAAGVMRWSPPEADAKPLLPGKRGAAGPVGGRLIGQAGRSVGVWEPPTSGKPLPPEPARLLADMAGELRGVSGTPDGSRVAVLTNERALHLADPGSGKLLRSWDTPSPVLGLSLSPAADRLTIVGRDGFVRCWDVTAPATAGPPEAWKARIPRSLNAALAAPVDGRFVAVASIIRVTLFDVKTGSQLHAFDRKWEDGPYRAVAVSPDGRLVAGGTQGSGGAITVWETATRTVVRRFVGNAGTVQHLAFLAGGRRLAAAMADDTVLLWDLTGRPDAAAPTGAELKAAWDRLDRDDGATGYPATWVLAAGGRRGLAVIKDGLARSSDADAAVKKLIADLDSDAFPAREAAAQKLKGYGTRSLPALTVAAEAHPSAEVRQRAAKVVADLARAGVTPPRHGLYGEPLRQVRAVAALEAVGGPEAAELLEELAKRGGRPGEAAEQALKRMAAASPR